MFSVLLQLQFNCNTVFDFCNQLFTMLILGAGAYGDDLGVHGRSPCCKPNNWIPSHEHTDTIWCFLKGILWWPLCWWWDLKMHWCPNFAMKYMTIISIWSDGQTNLCPRRTWQSLQSSCKGEKLPSEWKSFLASLTWWVNTVVLNVHRGGGGGGDIFLICVTSLPLNKNIWQKNLEPPIDLNTYAKSKCWILLLH